MENAQLTNRKTLDAPHREGSAAAPGAKDAWLRKLETWAVRNSGWLAIGIITAACALRVFYATSCYLNPDEGQHFHAARVDSWLGTLKAALLLAHPPLFILVLHAFLSFGRSELILRLPSLLAGTAALWLAFVWIRRTLGEIPALAGLLFMAVSRAAISASTEVRQYGLLLFFVCGALYATERALVERSSRWAMVQGFCLLGVLLSHFTGLVVIACIDVYVLVRSFFDHAPRRVLLSFGAMQLVLVVAVVWLYLAQFRHAEVSQVSNYPYLRNFYPEASETLFGFIKRALVATFSYMLSRNRARVGMVLFLAGLVAVLAQRTRAPRFQ